MKRKHTTVSVRNAAESAEVDISSLMVAMQCDLQEEAEAVSRQLRSRDGLLDVKFPIYGDRANMLWAASDLLSTVLTLYAQAHSETGGK